MYGLISIYPDVIWFSSHHRVNTQWTVTHGHVFLTSSDAHPYSTGASFNLPTLLPAAILS